MAKPRRLIIDVLREHPEGLSPDILLKECGHTLDHIEEFYRELRSISDDIEEIRPKRESTNQWPAEAQITLHLRST